MLDFNKKLDNYSRLVVEKGINVQKGQPVVIKCPIELAEFGKSLARNAYKAGAEEVVFNWYDDELTLMYFENAPMSVLETCPPWMVDRSKYYFEKNCAVISVYSEDPELLKDIDPDRIATSNKAMSLGMKEVRKYTMNDICSWCVVSAPTVGWATKVFPELSSEEAVSTLWDKIFYTTRCDKEDPVAEWDKHIATMDSNADFLNEKKFKTLHYTNAKGTDLYVDLPDGHIWLSAGSKNQDGTVFIANMPTEEVFTMPHKTGVNGKLYSTKPLNYGGNIIDEMEFTFKDGKVVEYDAKVGKQYLDDMFAVDENGKYLGEVALVPFDSPISNSGIVFINTLFDENASCHFAFGKAYPTCIENGTELDEKEFEEKGINDALIHEDFMVGSHDLSIVGITHDGEKIQIFENGNFVKH